jgi:hypothetical protein
MRSGHTFYGHEAGRASRELGQALTQANTFRSLLAETDAALRGAWVAGRLPAGIISNDLIERTRAALAGEAVRRETLEESVDRLSKLPGAITQLTKAGP